MTVGTSFERLRVSLSTWARAARAFSSDGKPTLLQIQSEIDVAYRTVLRMRDVIERAARKYRGRKNGFGAWPRDLMQHKRENREKTIQATVLKQELSALKSGEANRIERLLRLLLEPPKAVTRKRRRFPVKIRVIAP